MNGMVERKSCSTRETPPQRVAKNLILNLKVEEEREKALNSNLSRDFFLGLNLANYRLELNHSDLLRPSCVLCHCHSYLIPPRPMAFSSGYRVVVIAAAMTIVVVVVASSSSLVVAEEDVIHDNIMPNNAHEVRVKL